MSARTTGPLPWWRYEWTLGGNVSPNMGAPLLDCSRVASSWMDVPLLNKNPVLQKRRQLECFAAQGQPRTCIADHSL